MICQTCHVRITDGVDAHWGGTGSMGEELHYCAVHCPDTDCNPTRYPFDRLLAAMPAMPQHAKARILRMSGETWRRLNDGGLTDEQCERYALRAKLHPFQPGPRPVRGSAMKRTLLRRRRNPGVPRRVRVDIAARADGRCEYTFASADHPGDGRCSELATDLHHLLPRAQGGRHTVDNLVALCRAHHNHIHRHPADSYALGWLRRKAATDA